MLTKIAGFQHTSNASKSVIAVVLMLNKKASDMSSANLNDK